MSQEWADRQRRTNRLVRLIAAHIFKEPTVMPEQLYGLCKLTWITSNHDGPSTGYIKSTKIPGLSSALSKSYQGMSITDVANDVGALLASNEAKELVLSQTGFTNFYKPYRNSCLTWFRERRKAIEPLFRRAFELSSDAEGLEIVNAIKALPQIPKANVKDKLMKPEYLLTPIVFALDRRIRFPLINGNDGVRALLSALGASHAPLEDQYMRMIDLYGQGGIQDAADLDQVGHDLPDFIKRGPKRPTKKFLEKKDVKGEQLPIKDEKDIETLHKARTGVQRRLHNILTNTLREALAQFTLLEGRDPALFDVLVKNYKAKDDLLIEAKSSIEAAHIRMAVGQLFDYWFNIKGPITPHLAILTPEKPNPANIEMLKWLGIGVLWVEDGTLHTASDWLHALCNR